MDLTNLSLTELNLLETQINNQIRILKDQEKKEKDEKLCQKFFKLVGNHIYLKVAESPKVITLMKLDKPQRNFISASVGGITIDLYLKGECYTFYPQKLNMV